ncbi:tricarballylate dehydrogenase [Rhodococcus sp. 06-418-5]|uniref:FAD-dependent tricarballylate dehydrogenase TcuA n=1 Tax=Rhodococcus sp. 06-418-5 TaxID=2022507 RepID=UPI000B9ADEA3|nr:FAD-dependent tricarballylate dehydrogenase TcuA [Rhodococcus sp. 06-418-5]OZC85093.1 tricarballylate dehydrogenase [Rhodococcus sp. 06-418-5]OZC85148.1 tricarballylate dehydrogenase [Rhodococcus sp. 06-418-5]
MTLNDAQDHTTDVVVVGGGNAGFTAAHAAAARGRRVILLEKGNESESGGNSYYTAGATRIAHRGLADIADLIDQDQRHTVTEVPPYSADEYAADLAKVTDGRNDPDLTEVLVHESLDCVRWLHQRGLRYRLMYERQAYKLPDGTYQFWGGLHIGNTGGGQGLIADHTRVALAEGVDIRYGHSVTDLIYDNDRVTGVRFRRSDGSAGTVLAESTVLAAGGFEADAEMREQHLGAGWSHAKVRGTPLNTGEVLAAALSIGAGKGGDWTTCHSTAWDALAENNESNRELTNRLTRQSYPLGIVVNNRGDRFLDEGADFRNYTYAKYGKEILAQPDFIAYQIFDSALRPMLRTEEYDMPGVSETVADSVGELARILGIGARGLETTIDEFNASIDRSITFDPTVKDGRAARVQPPKSNWAAPIETPPFYAYPVTCGITFTFGGLAADTHGRVRRDDGSTIAGLLVCGEMLGGLFSGNYPGGSGLAAGAVFGRRAGNIA